MLKLQPASDLNQICKQNTSHENRSRRAKAGLQLLNLLLLIFVCKTAGITVSIMDINGNKDNKRRETSICTGDATSTCLSALLLLKELE